MRTLKFGVFNIRRIISSRMSFIWPPISGHIWWQSNFNETSSSSTEPTSLWQQIVKVSNVSNPYWSTWFFKSPSLMLFTQFKARSIHFESRGSTMDLFNNSAQFPKGFIRAAMVAASRSSSSNISCITPKPSFAPKWLSRSTSQPYGSFNCN